MKIKTSRLPKFWENVVEETTPRLPGISPCWVWIGPTAGGYGRFTTAFAHRVAAVIYECVIPTKVHTRCSNRLCVRREHLSVSVNLKPRKSRLTGNSLPVPTHKNPDIIKKVLADRFTTYKSNKIQIAQKNNVTVVTVNKIFVDAPLYDILDEIKESKNVQTIPHKKVDSLSPIDQQRYDFILSNTKPE